MINAGRLRHRVTVQRYVETTDPVKGYRVREWQDWLVALPAEWRAGPGREYLASEALRGEVQGRLALRWSPDSAAILASDRIIWDGGIWDIKSPPMVDATARREVLLMVARGVSDG